MRWDHPFCKFHIQCRLPAGQKNTSSPAANGAAPGAADKTYPAECPTYTNRFPEWEAEVYNEAALPPQKYLPRNNSTDFHRIPYQQIA